MADDGYELEMPFLCVKTNGGPYDDNSFAAGYQCGAIHAALGARNLDVTCMPVLPEVLLQVDLIAMRSGYTTQAVALADGWVHVTFTRVDAWSPDVLRST